MSIRIPLFTFNKNDKILESIDIIAEELDNWWLTTGVVLDLS